MSSRHAKQAVQARVWKLIFNTFIASAPARTAALEARELTPNDARALFALDNNGARPIGELARDWGCDPSNATFIVKRLAAAGLIVRSIDAADSRRRLVSLSARGERMKQDLLEAYWQPPPEVSRLTVAQLEELERLFLKLKPAGK